MKGFEEFKLIVLGCDHGGFELKKRLSGLLDKYGYPVKDLVPVYSNPIPFVDVARKVCKEVLSNKGALGILVCGTGAGMSIAANRIKGIHASVLYDDFTAEYSRRHTNANVLVFGGRTMKPEDALRRIVIFLSNEFEGGKYAERNRHLDEEFRITGEESCNDGNCPR